MKQLGLPFGICVLVIATQWSYTLGEDYEYEDFEVTHPRQISDLTPEEQALANQATAHVAKTIEKNLIRLLAVVASESTRRQPRQDDDDEDVASVTPNPNVIPQVAQILGAIFSGPLNLTRVVGQTFGLVPNVLRNQVGGIVKLLTGESMEASTGPSTASEAAPTTPGPHTVVVAVVPNRPSKKPAQVSEPVAAQPAKAEVAKAPTKSPENVATSTQSSGSDSTKPVKYKVRTRNRSTTSTTMKPFVEDDEFEKFEVNIKRLGRSYEPYMRNRQPKDLITEFRKVFGGVNFNTTEITRHVPSLFTGAKQALLMLQGLGVVDTETIFDELGVQSAKSLEEEAEEEEEEEEEE